MNLDEIDREVRDSLIAHADDAPSGAGTLDAVRSRSRRIRTRQRAGLTGIAALVAVAVAVGAPFAFSGTKHSPAGPRVSVGGPVVTTTHPTTTTPAPAVQVPDRATRVPLASGSPATLSFPLTPTFTPAGLTAPTTGRTDGEIRLVYGGGDSGPFLVTAVDNTKPSPDFTPTGTHTISVNGHSATLSTAGDNVAIIWKLHANWVDVYSQGVSVADAERYARGLTEHPLGDTGLPFTMALAPRSYVVSFQELHPEYSPPGFYFNLSAPRAVNDQSSNDHVFVNSAPDITQAATGNPVQVGDYPGKINYDSTYGIVTLYVLRPGFTYAVGESNKGPLSNADLIRMAAGVSPK